jgi:hypothetical protein
VVVREAVVCKVVVIREEDPEDVVREQVAVFVASERSWVQDQE